MPKNLRLIDYSDRELLLLVIDEASATATGFVSTAALAKALGLPGAHGRRSVGSRMAYMRRAGAVAKSFSPGESRWAVSPIGEVLARGTLSAAEQTRIARLPEGQLMLLTRALARRTAEADTTTTALTWREWRRENGRL